MTLPASRRECSLRITTLAHFNFASDVFITTSTSPTSRFRSCCLDNRLHCSLEPALKVDWGISKQIPAVCGSAKPWSAKASLMSPKFGVRLIINHHRLRQNFACLMECRCCDALPGNKVLLIRASSSPIVVMSFLRRSQSACEIRPVTTSLSIIRPANLTAVGQCGEGC